MAIAFYGGQLAPEVRTVRPETGWSGWFEDKALPLIRLGHLDHHLHNPFGLYNIDGRNSHVNQFELACDAGLGWLANQKAFAEAVQKVHEHGGTVRAYVGSPLLIPEKLREEDLPCCMPGAKGISAQLYFFTKLGLCGRSFPRCLCWNKLIRFYISVLVDAGVDAIGFDASRDFHPGDCIDRLVRELIAAGIEVMIEPWPLRGRTYPPVSWIIREQRFQRVKFDPRDDAPVEMVEGTIYRVVPADDSCRGREEIEFINHIREEAGESTFSNTQEIVDSVRSEGHIPLVRWHQLTSGSVV